MKVKTNPQLYTSVIKPRISNRISNLISQGWFFLSYPLSPEVFAYGGGHGFSSQKVKNIAEGDSCNTSHWSMSNHMGTHIDFPKHFAAGGKSLGDYNPGFFVSNKVYVLDISPIEPAQIIGPQALSLEMIPEDIDFLFIKTGFGQFRGQSVYSQQNPGFHPDLAAELRAGFPGLRVMGFDSISLSSFAHRELGREAHRAFLNHEHSILPLEDMDLSQVDGNTRISKVIVAPLLVSGADGSPCTVLALVKQ